MRFKSGTLMTLLVTALLLLSVMPVTQGYPVGLHNGSRGTDGGIIDLVTDQELINPDDLLDDIVPYLVSLKNQTGSWDIPSISGAADVYYGLFAGLSGVGMELLNIHELQDNRLSQESVDLSLRLAKEIGDHLIDAAESNQSRLFWPVTKGGSTYDLGYDFGISGIALFLGRLSNMTSDSTYADASRNALSAVDFLANHTGGLHWSSQMVDELATSSFYPSRELKFYTLEDYTSPVTYFNGLSLGSLGVARAAFDTINYLDITNTSSVEYKLLNNSIMWVESQMVEDGSESSFAVSEPSAGIFSTSISSGVSGAIDLYLDLFLSTGNSTYLDSATSMMNWLNGSETGKNRLQHSMVVDGTLSPSLTLGLSHGLTGTLYILDKYIDVTETDQYDSKLLSHLYLVHNYGQESDTEYKYAERFSGGIYDGLGSLSYSTGGGGTLSLIDKVADKLGLTGLEEDITKGKTHLYNSIVQEGAFQLVPWKNSGKPEPNPSVGFLSSYHIMQVSVKGQLDVETSELDFGVIELGSSKSLPIKLSNTGDEPILAQWGGISTTGIFLVFNNSVTIEPRTSFSLSVSFIPTNEGSFQEVLNIEGENGNTFEIDVLAQAFDLPAIEGTTMPGNGSVLRERENIDFVVKAFDSSGIERVDMSINASIRTMQTTVGSDLHKSTWDLNDAKNGTYVIRFTAVDNLGYTSSFDMVYTIAIYDPPLDERIFSQQAIYTLIALISVGIFAAIYLTRRYMS